MSALRSRRASATDQHPQVDTEKEPSPQQLNEQTLALSSIRSCYRCAFYSTAVDIFTEFSQPNQDPVTSLSFMLKLIRSLHILGFGIGLYRVMQVYKTIQVCHSLKPQDLLFVMKTFSKIWWTSSFALLVGAMAKSTDIGDYIDKDSLYNYMAPLLVLMVALVIGMCIVPYMNKGISKQDTAVNDEDMQQAHMAGFLTIRRMAFCIGMLGIDAFTLLLKDLLDPNLVLFERIYGLTEVAEPIAVAILLLTLKRQVTRFLATQLNNSSRIQVGTNQVYLYKAQQSFYIKVSSVFKSAATATLVSPYMLIIKTRVLDSRDWCSNKPSNKVVQLLAGCE